MWLLLVPIATAQVYPGDFGRIPSLIRPPDPVVVREEGVTQDPSPNPLPFPDGSSVAWTSDPPGRELVRADGPLKKFFRSGTLEIDAAVWTWTLEPKGLRGRRRLLQWTEDVLVPWLGAPAD